MSSLKVSGRPRMTVKEFESRSAFDEVTTPFVTHCNLHWPGFCATLYRLQKVFAHFSILIYAVWTLKPSPRLPVCIMNLPWTSFVPRHHYYHHHGFPSDLNSHTCDVVGVHKQIKIIKTTCVCVGLGAGHRVGDQLITCPLRRCTVRCISLLAYLATRAYRGFLLGEGGSRFRIIDREFVIAYRPMYLFTDLDTYIHMHM